MEIQLPPDRDYALKVRFNISDPGWEQWLFITQDVHWDSPECYLKLLHKHLKIAQERNALWIDGGDFHDVISGRDDRRGSKGTHREEHNKTDYLDRIVETAYQEFRPYWPMLIYAGEGNHERAVLVRKETSITNRVIGMINAERETPVFRAGYTGWIRFQFERNNQRFSHAMKIEHGTGGNSPVTKGVIQTNRRASRTEGATWFVSGHIHEQWHVNTVVERLNASSGRVELRPVEHIQVGSYKADFRTDGEATWAQMKMGQPKPIGGVFIRLYRDSTASIAWDVLPATKPSEYAALPEYLS